MKRGDTVRLIVPDNPRLDGAVAEVVSLFEWGAHVATTAAATGRFRALFAEMEPVPMTAPDQGFTSNPCVLCGSMRVQRKGPCSTCLDCGNNEGCS